MIRNYALATSCLSVVTRHCPIAYKQCRTSEWWQYLPLDSVGPHEKHKQGDSNLVTGTNCWTDAFGNIFMTHALRSQYKTTAVYQRPMLHLCFSPTFFCITVLYLWSNNLALLLTIASPVSSPLCVCVCVYVYIYIYIYTWCVGSN